jgi:NTE family protein
MRMGLVLGGGGAFGAAYHAGVLTALELDLGWDPRDADVIVGTSAGAIVASLLRLGVPPSDLAALLAEATHHATHPLVTDGWIAPIEAAEPPPSMSSPFGVGFGELWSSARGPLQALTHRWLRSPWAFDPVGAIAALMPPGRLPIRPNVRFFDDYSGERWPERELWLTTVRRRDLRRIVFGRGDLRARLGAAVAASCAVPGWFAPVEIGGERHVDGGVRSPTNADVLRHEELDVVVIVSAMSADARPGWHEGTAGAMRRYAHDKLMAERRALERAGIATVAFAPTADVLRWQGANLLEAANTVDIVREAFLATGEQLARTAVQAHLGPLARRRVPLAAAAG